MALALDIPTSCSLIAVAAGAVGGPVPLVALDHWLAELPGAARREVRAVAVVGAHDIDAELDAAADRGAQ